MDDIKNALSVHFPTDIVGIIAQYTSEGSWKEYEKCLRPVAGQLIDYCNQQIVGTAEDDFDKRIALVATTILQRAEKHPVVQKACEVHNHPYLLPAETLKKIVLIAYEKGLLIKDWQDPTSIDVSFNELRTKNITYDQLQRYLAFVESRPNTLSNKEIQKELLFTLGIVVNPKYCSHYDKGKLLRAVLAFFTAHPEILEHEKAPRYMGSSIHHSCVESGWEETFTLIFPFVASYPKILSSSEFLASAAEALKHSAIQAVTRNEKFYDEAFAAIVSLLQTHNLLIDKKFQRCLALEIWDCESLIVSKHPEGRLPAQKVLPQLQALVSSEKAPSPIWKDYRDSGEEFIAKVEQAFANFDERLKLVYDAKYKEFIISNSKSVDSENIQKIFDIVKTDPWYPQLANSSDLNGNRKFVLRQQERRVSYMDWE
jgi:hypothetical protein